MTQKDNVKQLIGKSLNAYNNKVLQQIDRIEKKNKEQNHKISMLTNELDNDYLTKTEEGSVISLEHSKEGMVYIDSLEGNTLVNYCTDGTKELTLNGDIDLEGTFVTTTEGVDNGKVDVYCEGNTLVNLSPNTFEIGCPNEESTTTFWFSGEYINNSLFKPNTEYSVIFYNKHPEVVRVYFHLGEPRTKDLVNNMAVFTTPSTITTDKNIIHFYTNNNLSKQQIEQSNMKVVILEGDLTNREMPPYFESMKSVGQDDVNGHKIEILSSIGKPNLIKNSGFLNDISNYSFHNGSQGEVMNDTSSQSGKILKITTGSNGGVSGPFQSNIVNYIEDKKYTLSGWCKGEPGTTLGIYIERHKSINVTFTNDDWVRFVVTSEQNPTNWNRTITFYSSNVSKVFYLKDIKIEESDNDTPYIPHISEKNYNSFNGINKKEILLNEPLRGLPNGVKDRFVKLGGKWYIERNCVGYTPDTSTATFRKNYDVTSIIDFKIDNIKNHNQSAQSFYMECLSTIPYGDPSGTKWQNETHWLKYYPMTKNTISTEGQRDKGSVSIFYNKEWTDQQIIDWCNNNNLKFILPCETPTYEEITDVELMIYLDTTHISNNSLIPCSMKVQNSGYNAIIKPSTLYTVALDTNKSGTIGMNLGGVKGTTTNNVLTLTTPATLSDDSLRLYGKGIKGSKVRLLEGDKTNWIPSHFEGMKSSFEDKFDTTDNTYKMEILSNNKNYFNYKGELNQYYKGMSIGTEVNINTLQSDGGIFSNLFTANHHGRGQIIKVKPYTNYIIKSTVVNSGRININTPSMVNFEYGTALNGKLNKTFNTLNNNEICLSFHTSGNSSHPNAIFYDVELILESNDNLDYIPNKSNKIQFSSIEPLRSVEDTKDKFVFKDGKLMIERNCKKIIVDNNLSWVGFDTSVTPNHPRAYFLLDDYKLNKRSHCDGFGFVNADKEFRHFKAHPFGSEGVKTIVWFYVEKAKLNAYNQQGFLEYFKDNTFVLVYPTKEPTYEEVPHELQKIILEGYENGTLFFDTNIPPTSTVRYAGETPIVKVTKLNKTKVLNNTNDINDNIIPYLMDMDYRVVCLQLATEEIEGGVSMARLFGGTYEMIKRDIQSNRLSKEEYGYRLTDYFNAGKLTEEEVRELEDLR